MSESCARECIYYDQCEHALNNHMKGSKLNPIKRQRSGQLSTLST